MPMITPQAHSKKTSRSSRHSECFSTTRIQHHHMALVVVYNMWSASSGNRSHSLTLVMSPEPATPPCVCGGQQTWRTDVRHASGTCWPGWLRCMRTALSMTCKRASSLLQPFSWHSRAKNRKHDMRFCAPCWLIHSGGID